MEWMILPLKRYFDFRGRSRRREFWMFVLFNIIVSIVASIIDHLLGFGTTQTVSRANGFYTQYTNNGPIQGLTSLALFIPNLSVAVRRLHDTDRTGWWVAVPIFFAIVTAVGAMTSLFSSIAAGAPPSGTGLIILIVGGLLTFVTGIVLLVFYCLDGTPGPNRFGGDPKDPNSGLDAEEVFG